MIKLPNTLSFRLTLWYTSAFVVFLSCAFLVLYLSIDHILDGRFNVDLEEDIIEFRLLNSAKGIKKVINEINREMQSNDPGQVFLRLLKLDGEVIFSTDLEEWKYLSTDNKILKSAINSESRFTIHTADFPDREYSTRIIYGLIDDQTVLHIGEPLEQKVEIMNLLMFVFVLMIFLVIPSAAGVGWLIARHAVSGINKVSQAAVDIKKGELDRRVSVVDQHDEIQTLADTFNSMADRIRKLITEMREMTDNIAHDLRSPIARIRANSETTICSDSSTHEYKQAAGDTLEECDRLIQLINNTLDVAEAEAGVTHTANEHIDLSKLTADACELFSPAAEEKEISFLCDVIPNCQLFGNKQNLQRMLANLIDNAIKFTPDNGKIKVKLNRNPDEAIAITVSDTGVGIPLNEQSRVFDRFYRCDQSRSKLGCGLGLSFAVAVARAHGGNIGINSIPNESSTFTVTVPA